MPKIIFNYKICDKAPECGGISVCPNGAISYDKVENKPIWNQEKCTFCLQCTLPSSCPIGAIIYAPDEKTETDILNTINSDPRTTDWLWQERYGVMLGTTSPLATQITPDNFDLIINDSQNKLIDVWHEEFIDCRLNSPLFSDLINDVSIYKLDAKKYPELAKKLEVAVFPSLLIYNSGTLADKFEGYLSEEKIIGLKNKLDIVYQSN